METIEFQGHNGDHFRLTICKVYGFPNETSPFGGYDTQSTIEIKNGGYSASGNLWITTGNIYSLYEQLLDCQKTIAGTAILHSYEGHLEVSFEYDSRGHVEIKGEYTVDYLQETCLSFKISSDQSFIEQSMGSLEELFLKYGDNSGQ